MKKILYIIWGVVVLMLICFLINHISNEQFINNYNEETYEENKITVFGFLEPYIEHYNRANVFYKNGEYEKATEEYKLALDSGITEERDCLARINMALSIIAPVKLDNVTEDNVEDILKTLREAQNVLVQNGCANEDGKSGHNEDAQTLWNEIEEKIKQLEEKKQQQNGQNNQGNNENQTTKPIDNKEQKEQQLKEYLNRGQQERQENIMQPEEMQFEDFYTGPRW